MPSMGLRFKLRKYDWLRRFVLGVRLSWGYLFLPGDSYFTSSTVGSDEGRAKRFGSLRGEEGSGFVEDLLYE